MASGNEEPSQHGNHDLETLLLQDSLHEDEEFRHHNNVSVAVAGEEASVKKRYIMWGIFLVCFLAALVGLAYGIVSVAGNALSNDDGELGHKSSIEHGTVEGEWTGTCVGAGPLPPLPQVPCLEVPSCDASGGSSSSSSSSSKSDGLIQRFKVVTPDPEDLPALNTSVKVCHTASGFQLTWNLGGAAVNKSAPKMSDCHASLWEGDAAEFYIAPSEPQGPTPETYSEIDVGPYPGGMWLGHIVNPYVFKTISLFLPILPSLLSIIFSVLVAPFEPCVCACYRLLHWIYLFRG